MWINSEYPIKNNHISRHTIKHISQKDYLKYIKHKPKNLIKQAAPQSSAHACTRKEFNTKKFQRFHFSYPQSYTQL